MGRSPESRRDFLLTALRPAVRIIDQLRSDHDREGGREGLRVADRAIESGAELAVVVLAIHTAIEGGKDRLVTVNAQPVEKVRDNPGMHETYIGAVVGAGYGFDILSNEVNGLSSAWENAYHKTRIVTYIDFNDDGQPVTRTRTEDYWDEPRELTSIGITYNALLEWQGTVNRLAGRFNDLKRRIPETSTFSQGLSSYELTTESIDQRARNVITTVGFGASAGIFAFYEEIVSHLSRENPGFLSKLANKKIKRRSFLKLGGGILATRSIKDIQKNVAVSNSGILSNVGSYKDSIINQMDMTSGVVFERYFGNSVDYIIDYLNGLITTGERALEAGGFYTEDWRIIEPRFRGVLDKARSFRENFSRFVEYRGNGDYEIPHGFVSAINSVWASTMIESYVRTKNIETNISAIAQVITMVGLFTGFAVSSEAISEAIDRALNKLRRLTEE